MSNKPLLVKPKDVFGKSIDCKNEVVPFFYNPWHYHPELEITLIQKGYGQRIVGDSIENFSEGDIVLIGSNLPHVWKSAPCFLDESKKMYAKAIVLKFNSEFCGKGFLDNKEMKKVSHLINFEANRGLKLTGSLKSSITAKISSIPEKGKPPINYTF